MTSNIGTSEGSKGTVGFRSEAFGAQNYQAALRRFFRLEFLNRLDDVVIFNALTQETLVAILELQLRDLRARLSGQSLKLSLEPSARELILSQGYDPANGARPLRRAIERLLIRPLSQRILDNLYLPDQTITASADEDGRLVFSTLQPTAASEA